jgi:hypothetical protein
VSDDATNEDVEETPEGDDPPAPDPVAQLRAEFEGKFQAQEQSLHQMGMKLAEAQGAYNALAADRAAGNKPTEEPLIDVSDDEIEAAMEAGDFKKAIALQKKQARIEAKRESAVLRETEIRPLQGTINNVGLPTMANLTRHVITNQLPEEARTFYEKHKDAVHAHVAKMPPEAQVDPEALRGAIAYEIGMQALSGGLKQQIDDEAERRIRSGNQPGTIRPGARGATTQAVDYEKVFGPGATAAAESKGGFDAYARSMGYEDMADYCRKTGVTIQ